MAQSRSITYVCSKCGHKNKIVISTSPHFGGREKQMRARNMPAEPPVYTPTCSSCGFVNRVSSR